MPTEKNMGPYTVSFAVFYRPDNAYLGLCVLTDPLPRLHTNPADALRFNDEKAALRAVGIAIERFGYKGTDLAIHKVYLSWEVSDETDRLVSSPLLSEDIHALLALRG